MVGVVRFGREFWVNNISKFKCFYFENLMLVAIAILIDKPTTRVLFKKTKDFMLVLKYHIYSFFFAEDFQHSPQLSL